MGVIGFSQITHEIDWKTNTDVSLTISQGDTVRWTWGDGLPHSVTSIAGVETFDSGISSGMGHAFNLIGITDYQCNVHSGNMNGRITVQPLSIDDNQKVTTQLYPNPASEFVFIKSKKLISQVVIVNVLGKQVLKSYPNKTEFRLDINSLPNGLYFVKLNNNTSTRVFKMYKK